MSDHVNYLQFVRAHPRLFRNLGNQGITILLDEDEITAVEQQMTARLVEKGLPPDWARVGKVFEDQYICLLRDAVRFPDGSTGTYSRLIDPDDAPSGVVVLPVYQGQVLLVHHFRHASREWFYEIPRGFGIPGLSVEETARRELVEEIGGIAGSVVSLGQTHPDTGMMSDCVELCFAEVTSYGCPELGEGIDEIYPVSIAEFERMLADNEITCGFTLAAYARAKLRSLI